MMYCEYMYIVSYKKGCKHAFFKHKSAVDPTLFVQVIVTGKHFRSEFGPVRHSLILHTHMLGPS